MKIICLIVDLFFLLAMGACAIGLIICAIKLFILSVDDWKEVNKKNYIHPSMYDKNYKEPKRAIDRILHRNK